jgi:hypothetical protein
MSDFVAFSVDSCAIFEDFESLLIRKRAKSGRWAHIREAPPIQRSAIISELPILRDHFP